ncbi:MAG: hypothetical protein KKB51_08805, partial [Candidatus Riflebacteria bacterium]|nr:hypothetical protein [Candidatus Riflebacteria bacterium]
MISRFLKVLLVVLLISATFTGKSLASDEIIIEASDKISEKHALNESPPIELDDSDFGTKDLQSSRKFVSQSGLCRVIYLMYTRSEDILATLKEVFQAEINSGALTLSHNPTTNS